MKSWQTYTLKNLDDDTFDMWCRAPNCGVGVSMVDGLMAIDVDSDNEFIVDGVADILDQYEGIHVRRKGAKGFAAFVRYRGEHPNFWRIDGDQKVVEFLGKGRQAVIPPTVHPDTGRPYIWLSDVGLEYVHKDDLPVIDAAFFEKVKKHLEKRWTVTTSADGGNQKRSEKPYERTEYPPNDPAGFVQWHAMAGFDRWVPDLTGVARIRPKSDGGWHGAALWRPSGSGRPLEKRKRNVSISPWGIKDFGTNEKFSPADLVMRSEGIGFEEALDWLWSRVGFKTEPFSFPDDQPQPHARTSLAGISNSISSALEGW